MADMKIKAVFEAIDKLSPPVKKMGGVVDALNKVFGRATKSGKDAATGIDRVEDKAKQAAGATNRMARASEALNKVLGRVGSTAKAAGGHIGGLIGKYGKFGLTAAATGAVIGVGAGAAFTKSVFDVSAEFESYGATLETVLGSQQKANQALDWVQTFAAKTPYDLSQVTDAFVKLNSYGIEATDGTLERLGNAASGMGKTLNEAVEALADAQTFSFERLKEFGVTTSQQGDKIKFTYHKAGKEIAILARKNGQDIKKELLNIFDQNFDGAMTRQSKTWKGLLSNLGDQWTVFQKKVGDAGVFKHIRDDLAKFLDWMSRPQNQKKVDEYAQKISDALIKIYDAAKDLGGSIDWPKFFEGVGDGIKLIASLAKVFGDLNRELDKPLFAGGRRKLMERQAEEVEAEIRAAPASGFAAKPKGYPKPAVPRPNIGSVKGAAVAAQVGGAIDININDTRTRVTQVQSVNPAVPIRATTNRGSQTGGVR